ncbi:hypothetical protein RhiirC2_784010 [Rhizophagus irregularis]|uniref:Uncharacterized protein n=1 Tax=Rhizophagus irregularis TaxID=588596 RepID=A0A2N1MN91_9GLOM|nr:hypothetical protein RhiirC2_789379 [Rhizophagus irregularis]PKK67047.1 hypothetical protein RhiirC2_784010 [Rhizophagus irregularis]
MDNTPQKVTLPKADGIENFERFKHYERMMYAPCVIKADFESNHKETDEKYGGSMRKIGEQRANSFSYTIYWIDTGEIWGPYIYRGPNATEEFVKRMDKEIKRINKIFDNPIPANKSNKEDLRKFNNAKECHLCKKSLGHDKVWDHCHITGKYRGAAHKDCNLKLQIKPWRTPIPVVIHNFRGYDSHLICESVSQSAFSHRISVIAETFERYKTMRVGQIKYIDSYQFMKCGLDTLAENIGAYYTKEGVPMEKIGLLLRKGVYPYKYINSYERFKETSLPPIEEFYSDLKGGITQKNYGHAQKVWKEFGCKNLGEYHDLYLKTDVLLLADVWTAFRETSMKYYELDPSHYVSAPSLTWDAMLKYTGVKIELFTDMEMHDFAEKAKRGGITMACKRYFKANNPKCKKFDMHRPKTWLSYVDANDLYGWAMRQYLPIGNYKWEYSDKFLKDPENKQEDIKYYTKETEGCLPRILCAN